MNAFFADTSFYVALFNPHDENNAKARRYAEDLDRPMITTAWVLTELANYLAQTANRHLFVSLLAELRGDRRVTIVPPGQELFEQGIRLYTERPDKDWSLTDCISFVVMTEHEVTDALSADHHFEQAGFNALLK